MAWVLRVFGVPVLSLGMEPEDTLGELDDMDLDVIAVPGDVLPSRPVSTGVGFTTPGMVPPWGYDDE